MTKQIHASPMVFCTCNDLRASMLNLFPIMFLALLAHAILRIATGAVFCTLCLQHIRQARSGTSDRALLFFFAVLEASIGGLLIVGFLTQAAALGALVYLTAALIFRSRLHAHLPSLSTHALLLGISLSLLITGAGAFAFDIPF